MGVFLCVILFVGFLIRTHWKPSRAGDFLPTTPKLVGANGGTNIQTTPTLNGSPSLTDSNFDQPKAPLTTYNLREASQGLESSQFEAALHTIGATLESDPKNLQAYLDRGAIYSHLQLWDRAESDYKTVLQLDDNNYVAKFNLAEIKFQQKDYEDARPGFAALEKNPTIGDLASYKVFLCDLVTRREDAARRELDAFNEIGRNASYYYANAAWDLSHHKVDEARGWLNSAGHIYNPNVNHLYSASLEELTTVHLSHVTFVTKQGKSYENVDATLENTSLSVRTPEGGWINIPFEQLPDDLSMFPEHWQHEIAVKRSWDTDVLDGIKVSSLTTKQGQIYHDINVFVENAGLRFHTADGWVSVPFEQLPDDLSAFPAELKHQIALNRPMTSNATTSIKVFSLTTKKGQTYHDIDVFVESAGLRFHTADGWISVPFEQLPDDLSAFPAELKHQITLNRPTAPNAITSIKVPNLTTKQGQIYHDVDVFVENAGLRFHTADGWVDVPFDQLPSDLSSLPPELRKQITSKLAPH